MFVVVDFVEMRKNLNKVFWILMNKIQRVVYYKVPNVFRLEKVSHYIISFGNNGKEVLMLL